MEITSVNNEAMLTACLLLRHGVFVEEQGVPIELEIDDHDRGDATHFAAFEHEEVVGTVRAVRFGAHVKLGRLAVAKTVRRRGIAQSLVRRVIDHAHDAGARGVLLDAQIQATDLYSRLGFESVGDVFDDAGLPHIRMVLEFEAD